MVKNITLSADERLIEEARKKAKAEGVSLNKKFREWLRDYSEEKSREERYWELMKSLSYVNIDRKYTREEMNERR